MFARTERLLLRPGWAEDAPGLAKAIADEGIVRNLASAPWPYTLADAEAMLSRERGPLGQTFLITRRTLGAPQLIGAIGFGPTPEGEVELGYWIARPNWGLGYATEAAEAVIGIARDGLRLKKMVAAHFIDNPASGRVLEKVGFRSTGRILPHYSLGRRTSAPCRHYELEFSAPVKAAEEAEADAQVSITEAFCMAA